MKLGLLSIGLALLAAPAMADRYTDCHAEAAQIQFTGAKSGYRAQYNAVVEACLARGSGYNPYDQRRVRTVTRVDGPCPPGAPKMYRGTLYCLN
jgi:hypothetical protein